MSDDESVPKAYLQKTDKNITLFPNELKIF